MSVELHFQPRPHKNGDRAMIVNRTDEDITEITVQAEDSNNNEIELDIEEPIPSNASAGALVNYHDGRITAVGELANGEEFDLEEPIVPA